jgi:ABC-type Zn uptake system ZnuABC Zn-binding protein ZnuA
MVYVGFRLRSKLSNFKGRLSSYGVRDLMNKVPYIKVVVSFPPLVDIAKEILGSNARLVRSVFFDKTEEVK